MTTTLNPVTTREWIAALRSGEYEQATGVLRGLEWNGVAHYCCMGVACDIRPGVEWGEEGAKIIDSTAGFLPDFVASDYFPDGGSSDLFQGHLARMNDERSRSFVFIARFLEIVLALQERAA